jgi:hypothetical protein
MTTASPALILHRGLITTLDRSNPAANAVAIRDGKFMAVGDERDVMQLAGPATRTIDLKGRRVLPGESGEKFMLRLDLRDSRRPKRRLFGGGGWNLFPGLSGSG